MSRVVKISVSCYHDNYVGIWAGDSIRIFRIIGDDLLNSDPT